MPVLSRGTSILPTAVTSFSLNNVLVAPALVHNLFSVRQFTRDNNCSIEFDASGFSVKDPLTRCVLLRCNSSGDLYTISPSFPSTAASCSLAAPSTLWHHRLGHPGASVFPSKHVGHHVYPRSVILVSCLSAWQTHVYLLLLLLLQHPQR
jgi:hypothetical protein